MYALLLYAEQFLAMGLGADVAMIEEGVRKFGTGPDAQSLIFDFLTRGACAPAGSAPSPRPTAPPPVDPAFVARGVRAELERALAEIGVDEDEVGAHIDATLCPRCDDFDARAGMQGLLQHLKDAHLAPPPAPAPAPVRGPAGAPDSVSKGPPAHFAQAILAASRGEGSLAVRDAFRDAQEDAGLPSFRTSGAVAREMKRYTEEAEEILAAGPEEGGISAEMRRKLDKMQTLQATLGMTKGIARLLKERLKIQRGVLTTGTILVEKDGGVASYAQVRCDVPARGEGSTK
eukprot:gene4698-5177_t